MKTNNNVYTSIIAGALLCVCSVLMAGYAAKVSLAQQIYHTAKYRLQKDSTPEELSDYWKRSSELYPHNYHLYIFAAENFWYNCDIDTETEDRSRLIAAEMWCNRGLNANYYSSQLRLLKTHLLEKKSVAAAIEYWEDYVDWHFWSPYNHAVLVDLYVKSGDFVHASDSLEWVKKTKYYKKTKQKLDNAWEKEMSM